MRSFIVAVLVFISCQSIAEDGILTKTARSAGFLSCINVVEDMNKFFSPSGHASLWSTENTSKRVFNSTTENTFTDSAILGDITIAALADGTCSYTYSKTWYSDKSCIATTKENYLKDGEYMGEVNKFITRFKVSSTEILLMPAGSGCIVQKKEMSFGLPKSGS